MNKKKLTAIAAAAIVALVSIVGYNVYANSDEVKLKHELAQEINKNDQQYEKNMEGVKVKSDVSINTVGNPLQSPISYVWEGNNIYRVSDKTIQKLDSTEGIPATSEMFSTKAQAITSGYFNSPRNLNVVNGVIYFIDGVRDSKDELVSAICSIKDDGTEYKVLQTIDSAYSSSFVVYKDNIFIKDTTPDTNTSDANAFTMSQMNLDGSGKTTILQAKDFTLPYCEDDKLYFERQDINNNGEDSKIKNTICSYDLNTKQISQLSTAVETFDAFGGNMWVRKGYCVYRDFDDKTVSLNYATGEKKTLVNAEAIYNNKIYYINRLTNNLYCSNTDGSNETKLSDDIIKGTFQLYNSKIVYSADLDGMPIQKSVSIN